MSCSVVYAENVSFLKYLVSLLVLLAFLLSLVLMVITLFRLHPTDQILATEHEFCVKCRQIELNPAEDIEAFSNFSIRRNGLSTLCCLNKFADIIELVARMVERKRRQKISQGFVNDLPIICGIADNDKGNSKLVVILPLVQNKSDQYMSIVQWNINSAASFVGSALAYINGSLRVTESAFYYLYSNLVYSQEWRNTTEDLRTFCHVLYLHPPMTETKYDTILMQSCNSLCKPSNAQAPCVGSSHMESVFFLRKGEEVYVRVSNPERLHESERNNVFGLFRM